MARSPTLRVGAIAARVAVSGGDIAIRPVMKLRCTRGGFPAVAHHSGKGVGAAAAGAGVALEDSADWWWVTNG